MPQRLDLKEPSGPAQRTRKLDKSMRIAITGGTGFVGSHLAQALTRQGHQVVLIARKPRGLAPGNAIFFPSDLSDPARLARALAGCDAIAHCAGINREMGKQTYQQVHLLATRNVVEAARQAGVGKILLLSFLRARPNCGSAYHESKWAAEEMVRNSGLDYTVIKSGMIYGRGDHMLDHLSHAFHTFPILPTVGLREKPVRPLAIQDLVRVVQAVLAEGRLSRRTIALTGAEELLLSEAARRVATVLNKKPLIFPLPVWIHYFAARIFELTMEVPLVARAQVRILSESVTEPWGKVDPLPEDLAPKTPFTEEIIAQGLPAPGPFTLHDLRCCLE
jgi:NADH dehydrogenase